MRFCKRTKLVIASSYKTLPTSEICTLIQNSGLTRRKEVNIQKHIDKLVAIDQKKEKRYKSFQKWALTNPISYRAGTLLAGAKTRAKAKGIKCTLKKEWVVKKLNAGYCEVSGIPFKIKPYSLKKDYTHVNPYAPSLDQIQPSGGYTEGNVQVVCDQINKMKGDRTITQTVKVARELIKKYDECHKFKVNHRHLNY